MSDNEAFGLYSKLYVLMRRTLSRSIDVQYLSQDKQYLAYVLKEAQASTNEELNKLVAEITSVCFPKPAATVTPLPNRKEKKITPEVRYTGSLR